MSKTGPQTQSADSPAKSQNNAKGVSRLGDFCHHKRMYSFHPVARTLCAAAVALLAGGSAAVPNGAAPAEPRESRAPAASTLHAAYLVGSRIRGRAELEELARSPFQLVYVAAEPNWATADFDLPREQAVERLVTRHAYPDGDTGNALVPALIAQAHRRNMRVLLCVQGTARGDFAAVAASAPRRACFSRTMAAFVRKYGYDGLDLDWERNVDLANHVRLMTDLRQALNAAAPKGRRYTLTTALQTYRPFSPDQARQLCASADWLNLMTYDLGGGYWGRSASHNTPLDGIQTTLEKWRVFPPDKLCIGLAGYGYLYRNLAPGQPCAVPLRKKGRSIAYSELPKLVSNGWKEAYDPAAQMSYYFSPDRRDFATIDNPASVKRKMAWILAQRFRGVFWWEYHHDYLPPDRAHPAPRHPLSDAAASVIGAGRR